MKTIHIAFLGIIVALAGTAWSAPKTKEQVEARGGKGGCVRCDLHGIDLRGKRLFMDSFQETNLRGAVFDNARLKGVRFIKADLTGASFKEADLTKANFEGANLTNADFTGAKFNQTNVRLATLTGTKGLPIPDPVPDPPHGRCSGKNICGLKKVEARVAATTAKPPKAVVRGGPNKGFLGAELYVTPGAGIAPGPGGFSVHQIVDALGTAKKTWKSFGKGQWMLTLNKTDQMSGKRLTMKILFARNRGGGGEGVLLKRVIANGQEFNQGQIFQLAQQLALKAEVKQ